MFKSPLGILKHLCAASVLFAAAASPVLAQEHLERLPENRKLSYEEHRQGNIENLGLEGFSPDAQNRILDGVENLLEKKLLSGIDSAISDDDALEAIAGENRGFYQDSHFIRLLTALALLVIILTFLFSSGMERARVIKRYRDQSTGEIYGHTIAKVLEEKEIEDLGNITITQEDSTPPDKGHWIWVETLMILLAPVLVIGAYFLCRYHHQLGWSGSEFFRTVYSLRKDLSHVVLIATLAPAIFVLHNYLIIFAYSRGSLDKDKKASAFGSIFGVLIALLPVSVNLINIYKFIVGR